MEDPNKGFKPCGKKKERKKMDVELHQISTYKYLFEYCIRFQPTNNEFWWLQPEAKNW